MKWDRGYCYDKGIYWLDHFSKLISINLIVGPWFIQRANTEDLFLWIYRDSRLLQEFSGFTVLHGEFNLNINTILWGLREDGILRLKRGLSQSGVSKMYQLNPYASILCFIHLFVHILAYPSIFFQSFSVSIINSCGLWMCHGTTPRPVTKVVNLLEAWPPRETTGGNHSALQHVSTRACNPIWKRKPKRTRCGSWGLVSASNNYGTMALWDMAPEKMAVTGVYKPTCNWAPHCGYIGSF